MRMTCAHCHGAGTVPDVQLTQNFRLSEFTRSHVAAVEGVSNLPAVDVVDSIAFLCRDLLQPLRDRFGALRVTSGYRSPTVNAAVGGSPTSAHVTGNAADIVPVHASIADVMAYLPESGLEWDQAIDEGTHLHIARVSSRGEQRRQLMRLHTRSSGGEDVA